MKLRCLLVDDEPPALKVLQQHIAQINGLEIAAVCKNAIEAMDILSQQHINIMFLDIKLPKISGTEFLRSLPHPPIVIITTAYREFAIDGFDLNVVDYLLKPISFERFVKAIQKVKKLLGNDPIFKADEYAANANAFVYLKIDKSMAKIIVNEILFIESRKDYVEVFLSRNRRITVKQSIASMENMLSAYKFIRVHRSFMISLQHVSGYTAHNVHIQNVEIPIGRLYKKKVLETIAKSIIF